MPRTAFSKAIRSAPATEPGDADTSHFYADVCSEYKWTPTYIKNELTNAQLYGFWQHLPRLHKRRANLNAWAFVDDLIKRVFDPIFSKKKD